MLSDENDLYGGLGRNGAVRTPEARPDGQPLELLQPGGAYPFAAGRIFIADTNNHAIRVASLPTGDVTTLVLRGL